LLSVGAQQGRAQGKEQLFEATAIVEALAQQGDQVLGDVHAAAALVLGEGENPGGVFLASGAGGAVFSNAGFLNQSQGAFEGGPQSGQLSQELLLQGPERNEMGVHV
jgi:hypothetical protein